ncbi:MAG: DUF262 domain-containing protein [Bacteroides sp.]|nr:DUF262 domain-containing protein [Bacteroides sp.]MCM1095791.1 DUF262 domain-containing protein [Terasakiella sp.]
MPLDSIVNSDRPTKISFDELQQINREFSVESTTAVDSSDNSTIMSEPFDPKQISIVTQPFSLDNIIKRLREGEIDMRTKFQRKSGLWSDEQKSRLIESLLIKLPLPQFYFDGSDEDCWLVVDGLQRLTAIKEFLVDGTLRLRGLEFLHQLNGLKYQQLSRPYQRQIEESTIQVSIITKGTPEMVKYNIFKRLNTGGIQLEPQEIRHALHQGVAADLLRDLAALPEFVRATDNAVSPERMLDREFVNRFIAFYYFSPDDYKTDLDTFLSTALYHLAKLTTLEREELRHNFREAMSLAFKIFGYKSFRKIYDRHSRRNPVNKALFDVWSVELARLSDDQRDLLARRADETFTRFVELMNGNRKFVDSISSSTDDRTRIKYRFSEISNLIKSVLAHD